MITSAWPAAPVVVLGAGPVGQTTALLLARWGVPSVVLDRRPRRDAVGSKAICQQRDVLDVWESVGAGAQIAAEGVTWTTARTYHRGTELFSYRFAETGTPAFPPFVNISQSRTEQILDERIAAEPLVDLRWGHDVVDVAQDGDGVTVRCADGATVPGSYLVVCGGARSDAIRQQLGVTFDGRSFDDRFLICDIRADLPGWATERRFHFDPVWNPGRQVLIHPCPDSTFRIDWQVPAGFDLDAETESGALDARIRAIIGDVPYEIVWRSVYRFQSRCVDRMRRGRVLIAGDAAHLVSPFGARGLNSGVADAENAAWKIAHVGRGWAPDALLESYHAERHAAAVENLAVTTATMDFLVPPDGERARRRESILAAAATDPEARAQVDSGRLAEPFWYADSPLTTPSPDRPDTGRPARGAVPPPGPGVLVVDGPVVATGRAVAAAPGPAGRAVEQAAADALLCSPLRTIGTAGDAYGYAEQSSQRRRFRELARDGFLLLLTAGVDVAAARAACELVVAPVQVAELALLDPTGALTAALDARPGEVWVIRPDAHVAAVVDQADIADALLRALAIEGNDHGALPAIR